MNKNLKMFVILTMIAISFLLINTGVGVSNRLTRKTLPASIQDGDWFLNGSKIIFSERIETEYIIGLSTKTGERFRIFIINIDGTDRAEIAINASNSNIDSEDWVALLVSPDEQKIAFVVTRHDHPSAVYIMNPDGSSVQKIKGFAHCLAFAWLSDKEIILWQSNGNTFRYFSADILSKGSIYIVNINNGDTQELTEVPEQLFEGKFVSSWYVNTEGDAILVKDLLREGYTFPDQTENNNQEMPDIFIVGIILAGVIIIIIITIFGFVARFKRDDYKGTGGYNGGYYRDYSSTKKDSSQENVPLLFRVNKITRSLFSSDKALEDDGRKIGTLSKDFWSNDRQIIKNRSGKKTGSIDKDPWDKDKQVIKDDRSRKVGDITTNFWGERIIKNSNGKKIGTIKKNIWGETVIKKD